MMKKQRSLLARATREAVESIVKLELEDIQGFLIHFGQTVVIPLLIGLCALVIVWEIGRKIWRLFFPPGLYQLHNHAKYLYRNGNVPAACQEWNAIARLAPQQGDIRNDDEDSGGCFAPAVMSLACHEIYVAHSYQKGLRILKQAQQYEKQQRVLFLPNKEKNINSQSAMVNTTRPPKKKRYPLNRKAIDAMILDAEAYLAGSGVMVESMNAPLAKLEYLGISTRPDAAKALLEGRRRRRLW